MQIKKYFIFFYLIIFSFSCAKLTGEFAVKTEMDDTYRKVTKSIEIMEGKELQWVYSFKNIKKNKDIGVFLMKSDLVRVEISSRKETINKEKKIIYGTIKELPVGNYEIVISDTKNNASIDSINFSIYSKRDDD